MAVPGVIKGQQLADNLLRADDIAINTDLLNVDVTNNRIGVNEDNPLFDLDVNGSIASNVLNVNGILYSTTNGEIINDTVLTYNSGTGTLSADGFSVGSLDITAAGLQSGAAIAIDAPGHDVTLTSGPSSNVTIDGLTYPKNDGSNGQVLSTDGAGNLSFTTVNTSFTIQDSVGGTDIVNTAETLLFQGGTAISTVVTDNVVTYNVDLATTSTPGIASFDPLMFTVDVAGKVAIDTNAITTTLLAPSSVTDPILATNSVTTDKIQTGAVTNTKLEHSSLTIGDQTIELGNTENELTGLLQLGVDDLTFDGSTITAVTNMALVTGVGGIIQLNTNAAVVMPGGQQTDRPASPTVGMMRYNYTTNVMEYWNSSEWVVAGEQFVTISVQDITPDGISSSFVLNQSATTSTVLVTLNGLLQEAGTAYTVNATNIDFTGIPQATDLIQVRFLTPIATITSIADALSGSTTIEATDTEITMDVAGQEVISLPVNKLVDLTNARSLGLPVYTVATASAIPSPTEGEVIYVSNGNSGQPCLAVYDGTSWTRLTLGLTISAS